MNKISKTEEHQSLHLKDPMSTKQLKKKKKKDYQGILRWNFRISGY